MDELLDLLESNEKPFKEEPKQEEPKREYKPVGYSRDGGYNNGPKKENLWDKTDFKPLRVDVEHLNKAGKVYSIREYSPTGTFPDAIIEKFVEIAKVLATKGFTYRYSARDDNKLQNAVIAVEGMKFRSYLPWKKFNVNVVSETNAPSEKAYSIAMNSHKIFAKLPAPLRAVIANDIHIMLGTDCKDPLEFLLVYSECGSEKLTKTTDFKLSGSITVPLKIAEEANIPVFNFKNDDAIKRLVEFLKAH